MSAGGRISVLYALRTFFRDLQHWEIIPRSFDPHITFRVPQSLKALIGCDPRVLADDVWAKFIAAKFEHDIARPLHGYVAPQLHTHAVIFNVTERDTGRDNCQPRAIQPQSLFASQQFATAIYQSEPLCAKMSETSSRK